jgi:hypothetical protein
MSEKKAAVNFQHQGVWYGPDHGGAPVPAEIAKAVGAHVFGEQPEQVNAEEDADPAPAKARTSRPAKD